MGRGIGKAGPRFTDGPEFETIGMGGGMGGDWKPSKRDKRFSRIVCRSCGTIIGMALHGTNGPAYCGACWDGLDDSGGSGGAGDDGSAMNSEGLRGASADGERHGLYGFEDGASADGSDDRAGDGAESGGGDAGGQVRRMRALMRSLEAEHGGPPTRRQVLDGMVLDGGDGAWKGLEAAEWCLDNVLTGIIYEPEAGHLSMIDGE